MFLKWIFFILNENVNVIFTHQKCVTETSKQAYSDFVVDVDEPISVFDGFKVLSFYHFFKYRYYLLLFASLIKCF